MIGDMWALGRRTALFIVSYTPLAAMFLALRWPAGWDAVDLVRLALAIVGAATCVVALFGLAFASGRTFGRVLAVLAIVGGLVAALAVLKGWTEPFALEQPPSRASAAAAAVALFFIVVGIGLLWVILHNAGRGTPASWTIADPRDQGGAVAAYLASYLLPLLNPDAHGTRIAVAYAIYLLTLYIVFVRSESLVTINPMIYLFRYRIFDVALAPQGDGAPRRRVLLLSKSPLKRTMEVDAVPFGDDCYVVVDKEAA